ncbi:MAG TPA: ammonia-forming cytochrome c nitrite reductase subunit c552 [Oligoflexus sp.]|uniref:ammonia-forming cytochrome c nitrite reductase subunit c552 n=1 Tax=Oligoflexus sp. TaxID=1971216 RepID=UPI002D802AE6|nr:ammonia-forming cytochrome c nitrite reductase subunit c552 [Oligoflexus sp.]HET9235747.1 ammonia-forming cytochrome c nitrite reductase subunit c552 [Oligoflexus sp.]
MFEKFRQLSRTRIVMISVAVSTFLALGISALLVNIMERKNEARQTFINIAAIGDDEENPAEWGKNFPLQYEGYRKTVDQVRTRFGGSEALARTPSEADPRSVVAQSKLEEDPRLKDLWAGYAFSKDFREERGHAYMLVDQIYTERQKVVQQPGTCIHCHASTYVTMKKLGDGDLQKGFEAINSMPYQEARTHVTHPVSCIDCHEPQTLALRVTRPAFMEGIRAYRAFLGQPDYDVNKQASRQEMRTYVCAQCHVEYYFKGPEKRLTYPWAQGIKADQILAYYDEVGHKDWEHKISGAPALKAQHPEFELWSQGIHARSGVACADCHMPYTRSGAMKVSDHHVQSPLLNINRACLTCHKSTEDDMKNRVAVIQGNHFEMRNLAMDAVVALIKDIEKVKDTAAPEQLSKARDFQRKAQFLLDFAEAENSSGFHAPQEAARIMLKAVDYSRQGQNSLKDL